MITTNALVALLNASDPAAQGGSIIGIGWDCTMARTAAGLYTVTLSRIYDHSRMVYAAVPYGLLASDDACQVLCDPATPSDSVVVNTKTAGIDADVLFTFAAWEISPMGSGIIS